MMNLQVIEQNNERVLTTQQLADIYECDAAQIKLNFNRNKERFEEGKHYFKLEGDSLREFKASYQIDTNLRFAPVLYLWTKRGASRHSKMLGTDKAWDMFDALEENYFNPRPKQMTSADAMKMVLANPRTYAKMLMEFADVQEQNAQLISENIMLSNANEGLEQKNMALENSIARKDIEISDLQDKVALENFFQAGTDGLYTATSIASVYGWSAKRLNLWLKEKKIQYWTGDKKGGHYVLYASYAKRGLAAVIFKHCTDGEYRLSMRWTKAGIAFVYNLLRKNGFTPLMEVQYEL